jgi:hypothetical protein
MVSSELPLPMTTSRDVSAKYPYDPIIGRGVSLLQRWRYRWLPALPAP